MNIQPTLLILFTLLISSVFSIIKLRSDAHAVQQSTPSSAVVPASYTPAPTTPTPTQSEPLHSVASSRDSQGLLKDAHLKLVSHSTIRAKLLQTFYQNGEQVLGRGEYLQSAPMRLKYTLELDQEGGTAKLIQVCDSSILWTHQELCAPRTDSNSQEASPFIRVTRRNVKRVLDEVSLRGNRDQYLSAELGLGGLPALLTALNVNMTFGEIEQQSRGETPCFVLTGSWTDQQNQLWAGQRGQQKDYMTRYRPNGVKIWLDQQTLFPVEIQYLNKFSTPIFSLAFEDIRIGEPIDPAEFSYTPPKNVTPSDTTHDFLNRLGH